MTPQQGHSPTANPAPATAASARVVAYEEFSTGPLPTPQVLGLYNDLLPGAAERIFAMAEREQAHRMSIEEMATRADIIHRDEVAAAQRENAKGVFRSDMAGQLLGAFIAVLCVGSAAYTASIGAHPSVSVALVGLPLAAVIKALRNGGEKPK